MPGIDRRRFMALSGSALALPVLNGGVAFAAAEAPSLVVVNLQGGMDGLAAIAPYGDRDYAKVRSGLAQGSPRTGDLLDLDGFFGLHPALKHCRSLYGKGELTPAIGIASPYRARSHFDAQDVLSNGTTRAAGRTGWLNRALVEMNRSGDVSAVSVGSLVPLLLRGDANVSSLMPSIAETPDKTFIDLMDRLYAQDARLGPVWQESRRTAATDAAETLREERSGKTQFATLCSAAAQLLNAPAGPRVISLQLSGWDTHLAQGTTGGRIDGLLSELDKGLAVFTSELRPNQWARTAVVVMSEFGRTVRMNGTKGTDHGTGGGAMVLGGAVRGGTVLHDWRGLDERHLYEGRDLYPALDLRTVFKSVLHDHMKIGTAALDTKIFPDSGDVPAHPDLIRA